MAINDKMFEDLDRNGGLPHAPHCDGDHNDGTCIAIGVYDIAPDGDLPHKIIQICLGKYLQVQFTMDLSDEESIKEIGEILQKLHYAEKHHIGPTIMDIFNSAAKADEERISMINELNKIFKWGQN